MLSCILLLRCVGLVADSTCRRCTRRGTCLLCRLLPPAFSLLSCPLSPQPALAERSSPAGKGVTKSLFRRGLRPRHPCTEPLAALTDLAAAVPSGGRACFVACYSLPLACFPAPYPPAPFPGGEGGDQGYFMQGAPPLASPAFNRLRHLQLLPYRYPAKGSLRLGAKTAEILSFGQCRQPRRGGTGGEELRRLRWSSPPG